MELEKQVADIIVDVLGDKYAGTITAESNVDNVEDWDSYSFINIVVAIEEKFDLKFSMDEAVILTQVSSIVELLNKKIKEN